MSPTERHDVLRCDREKRRQKQQVVVVGVVQDDADRHHADVRAQRDDDRPPAEQPGQPHVERASGDDRQEQLQGAAIESQDRAAGDGVEREEQREGHARVAPPRRRDAFNEGSATRRSERSGSRQRGVAHANDS